MMIKKQKIMGDFNINYQSSSDNQKEFKEIMLLKPESPWRRHHLSTLYLSIDQRHFQQCV